MSKMPAIIKVNSLKEQVKLQVESISKPRPGESQQDFLKRKGVIK
jgi:hypothetical protein